MNRGRTIRPTKQSDMKKGDLFYWHKTVLVEYVGMAKDGRYMFQSTNGGIIYVYADKIYTDITK